MLRILKGFEQIEFARFNLKEQGLDTSQGWKRTLFTSLFLLRYRSMPPPVALNKSWDVWTMMENIRRIHPDRATRIFDMGSFNSEIPLALWSSGYRRIRAADFDPRGCSINWYGNRIKFRAENFYEPSIADGSLDVITALSAIEHGYDQQLLLGTARRLLRKGGTLWLTTDYHEEKIPIDPAFKLFGLPYQVFSRNEIESLLAESEQFGFDPTGNLAWTQSEYPIEWLGHRITFILLSIRKVTD